MARVMMKVTADPVRGYKVGDQINVTEAVARVLEATGKAERVRTGKRAAPADVSTHGSVAGDAARESEPKRTTAVAEKAPAKRAAKKAGKAITTATKKTAAKRTYRRRDMKAGS